MKKTLKKQATCTKKPKKKRRKKQHKSAKNRQNRSKKTQKMLTKMTTKTLRKHIKISGNTTQPLQTYYRPRPQRTHTWDKHVPEQLHKGASIGSKRRQKNNKK